MKNALNQSFRLYLKAILLNYYKLHFPSSQILKIGMLILTLCLVSIDLGGWNILWNSTTGGSCRSPVTCRNLTNDGIVSASFWFHHSLSSSNAPRIKFIETDDASNTVYRTEKNFDWGAQGAVQKIVLHKIIQNPSEDGYLLLGTAFNPGNALDVSSFVAVIDNQLVVSAIHTISSYEFWDIAVAPETRTYLKSRQQPKTMWIVDFTSF